METQFTAELQGTKFRTLDFREDIGIEGTFPMTHGAQPMRVGYQNERLNFRNLREFEVLLCAE